MQASYSEDGIFVGMGTYCGDFSHDDGHAFLSVLYAYSKKTLYSKPGDKPCVWAAAYYGPTSWYRSVPPPAQMVIEDSFKPFNNYIQPSRPQDKEDVTDKPMFVMKVRSTTSGRTQQCQVADWYCAGAGCRMDSVVLCTSLLRFGRALCTSKGTAIRFQVLGCFSLRGVHACSWLHTGQ